MITYSLNKNLGDTVLANLETPRKDIKNFHLRHTSWGVYRKLNSIFFTKTVVAISAWKNPW